METLTTEMSGYFRPAPAVTSSHSSDKLLVGMETFRVPHYNMLIALVW